MSKLTDLTIKELNIGYDKKEFKASEVTEAYLKNIDASSNLNAYITVTADEAMAQSKLSDERIGKGSRLSKMDGVPIGVKDLFCTKDIRTTAASHILDDFVPPYESTVTSNLLNAGSIFLGKTNLDEFAMGGANLTSYFGEAINPIKRATDNKEVVTGGSSGGSAASVAGGLAAAALGTDTGGSIRQPTSLLTSFFLCFPGQRCDKVFDGCKSRPCKNGGTCAVASNTPHGFICKCPQVSNKTRNIIMLHCELTMETFHSSASSNHCVL